MSAPERHSRRGFFSELHTTVDGKRNLVVVLRLPWPGVPSLLLSVRGEWFCSVAQHAVASPSAGKRIGVGDLVEEIPLKKRGNCRRSEGEALPLCRNLVR